MEATRSQGAGDNPQSRSLTGFLRSLLPQASGERFFKPVQGVTGYTLPSPHLPSLGATREGGSPLAHVVAKEQTSWRRDQGPRMQTAQPREGKRNAPLRARGLVFPSARTPGPCQQARGGKLTPLPLSSAPAACLPFPVPSSPWLREKRSKPRSRRTCR